MDSVPPAVTRDFILHAGMPVRALGNASMTAKALRDAAKGEAERRAKRLKVIRRGLHVIEVPDALGPMNYR